MTFCRSRAAATILALAGAFGLAQMAGVAPAAARQAPPTTEEALPLTVDDVLQMLQSKVPEDEILEEKGLGAMPLTIDDVARLKKAGASDRLIRALTLRPAAPAAPAASPAAPAAPATPEQQVATAAPPAASPAASPAEGATPEQQVATTAVAPVEQEMGPGKLRLDKVLYWERSGMPLAEIAARVDEKGLKQEPELKLLLALLGKNKSPDFVRLLAQGRSMPPARLVRITVETAAPVAPSPAGAAPQAAAATVKRKGILSSKDILKMLNQKQTAATVTGTVIASGMKEPITTADETALRAAGADDQLIKVIHLMGGSVEQAGAKAAEAKPLQLEVLPPGELPHVRRDTILVTSVPAEAEVFIAPAGMPRDEMFARHYMVGRTPVAVPVAPGRYNVIVRKRAGNFEQEMIPAWRTLHDSEDARLLLDNADLTFDPKACCLPGALDDTVQLRLLARDSSGVPLGDRFDGFAPYLFDGEALQILSIEGGSVQATSKLYTVDKGSHEPIIVAATFFQADADPLDTSLLGEEFATAAFDGFLMDPALSFLEDPAQVTSLAGALRIQPQEAASAISMLRRTGKGIVPQDASPGKRLVILSVDGPGSIHLHDATIRPADPFAAPAVDKASKKKKKKTPPPPPEPPPLPEMRRHVIPGLGQPRLIVNNTTGTDTALIFSDGQLYFVPANTEREFVLDPGTYVVRLAAPGHNGPEPQGQLHFSYQARYTMTL